MLGGALCEGTRGLFRKHAATQAGDRAVKIRTVAAQR
jgi:hypothetical protein